MRKIFILSAIVIFCSFVLFSPSLFGKNNLFSAGTKNLSQTTQRSNTNKNLCGPRSLLTVCQILGAETNLDELSCLSGMDKDTGATMLGLYQAAQRKGLKAEGLKMGIEELAKLKSPAIAHTKGNHFLVIECLEKDKFRILDPPKEPYYLTKEELSKVWDGNVLVVSKKLSSKTYSKGLLKNNFYFLLLFTSFNFGLGEMV